MYRLISIDFKQADGFLMHKSFIYLRCTTELDIGQMTRLCIRHCSIFSWNSNSLLGQTDSNHSSSLKATLEQSTVVEPMMIMMPQQITRASANCHAQLWSRRSRNRHRALGDQFVLHTSCTAPGSMGSTSRRGRPMIGRKGHWVSRWRRGLKTRSRLCHSRKEQSRGSSLNNSTEKSRHPCCDFHISPHKCHS